MSTTLSPYSYSRLSCYEQCPRRFKHRYIDELVVERKGIEAFAGSMVHLALQHLYLEVEQGRPLEQKELLAFFNEQWDRNDDGSVVVVKKGSTSSDYRMEAARCLLAYHRRYYPFCQGATVGLEQGIRFKVRGEMEHELVGYIDRLTYLGEGVYEVHDYKTGRRLPTLRDLRQDRQLALYEIGVRQNYPDAREVRLVWHYLHHDQELRSFRTPDELIEVEREVGRLIDRIECCKEFPRREGPLCRWCEFFEICQQY